MCIRDRTKSFKHVQELLIDEKNIKKQLRSISRRLKTIELKHSFLNDITSVNGKSTLIEIAAKRLFKSAGFGDVRHLQNVRPKREDLQIWCDDCVILVECKGSKNTIPQDNEIGQIKKYIDNQPELKHSDMLALHRIILKLLSIE